jgi:hypothetical protein
MPTRHRASLAGFIAVAAVAALAVVLGGCSLGASTSAAVAGTPEARSDPGGPTSGADVAARPDAPGAVQAAEPFAVGSGGLGSPSTLHPTAASPGFRGVRLGGVEPSVSITSAVAPAAARSRLRFGWMPVRTA